MAQQIITFDPDVGVPMGVNLTMFSGADFNTTFTIRTSAGSSIDFTNYTGRSNMKKSAIGTANTFGVSLGDTDGKITLSMGSTVTRSLSEGRYLYDINVSSGSTFFKVIEGNVPVSYTHLTLPTICSV